MEAGHEDKMRSDSIWYFGFGSNMKSSTMKRRSIEVLQTKAVRVPGFILTFDVFGLPYSEPSMASIARYASQGVTRKDETHDDLPDVHGIAFLITASDFIRVIATEGGGVAYSEITVNGVALDDGSMIPMHTLIAKYPRRPNAAPSTRYLRLLQEGAEEHRLPAEYQAYLRKIPCYSPSGLWWNRTGAFLFLFVARKVQQILARRVKDSIDVNGRCPPWYGVVIYTTYIAMWWWHDYVFATLFGSGNGGKVEYGSLQLLELSS